MANAVDTALVDCTALKPSPFYHIAFLTQDIRKAQISYGIALGLTFRPPQRRLHRIRHGEGETSVECWMTYSTQGPLYIELMQVGGEAAGIWPNQEGNAVHHAGLWSANPSTQAQEMQSSGFTWECSLVAENGFEPVIFVRRDDVRIELAWDGRRSNFEDWVAGRREAP